MAHCLAPSCTPDAADPGQPDAFGLATGPAGWPATAGRDPVNPTEDRLAGATMTCETGKRMLVRTPEPANLAQPQRVPDLRPEIKARRCSGQQSQHLARRALQGAVPRQQQILRRDGCDEMAVLDRDAGLRVKQAAKRSACNVQAIGGRKLGRSGGIRTPGPLVPNQMRYQAALHSDGCLPSGLVAAWKAANRRARPQDRHQPQDGAALPPARSPVLLQGRRLSPAPLPPPRHRRSASGPAGWHCCARA